MWKSCWQQERKELRVIDMKQIKSKMGIGRGRHPPMPDYSVYQFSKKELAVYVILEGAFIALTAYLFYDSIFAFFLLMPLEVMALKAKKEQLCQKRKQKLEAEFRDVILSVSSNLQTGYSFENAFQEAYKEIVILYGDASLMACELRLLLRRLANNEQLEDALLGLAKRSGVQDIRDFAEIFQIAKRGGGNMQAIIASTAELIGDKQAVRAEIDTIMSEKKLEQTIMRYIPFFIIIYISATSKGYFDGLYHNLMGQAIMTAALVVYGLACKLSDRILEIEV